MIAAPPWQTAVFCTVAAVAVTLHMAIQPSLGQQLLILAPLVAVLGLPHGALDLPVATALWRLDGPAAQLLFAAGYIGVVGLVIGVWVLLPGAALVTFLMYSAFHFSEDWSQTAGPLRWTGGIATIGAPALWHTDDVSALFAQLAPGRVAMWAADAAAIAGIGAGIALVYLVLTCPAARDRATVEQVVLWISAAILSPLFFFAVYFCSLHSVRHFTATLTTLPNARHALGLAAGLSAAVVAVAVVVATGRVAGAVSQPDAVIMQTVFIGLAALTVPHMLLTAWSRRTRPSAAVT